jgi:hypothetical protein
VVVINDDNEPEVTIVATTSGSEPGTNGVFTVSRTGATTAALTVNYTVAGTATAGGDYTALSGQVTIPIGASSAPITVPVLDDPIVEVPETVIVTLTPNLGVYTVSSPSAATVNIADEDVSGFIFTPITGNTSEAGATATFTVRLSSQPTADATARQHQHGRGHRLALEPRLHGGGLGHPQDGDGGRHQRFRDRR